MAEVNIPRYTRRKTLAKESLDVNTIKKIKTYFVFFAYILLPLAMTRKYWTSEFIDFLNSYNPVHNDLGRNTYNPEDYKSGQNFLNEGNRLSKHEGQQLDQFLREYRPEHVLEIGPGSGFFSRQIFDADSVIKYTSLEVNSSFCLYLDEATKAFPIETTNINFDYKEVPLNEIDCDTIVAISSLHHMHDRTEFLTEALGSMNHLKQIFIFDPAHYLPRVIKLFRKLTKYWKTNAAFVDSAWSTHHFITVGEFNKLKSKFPGISICYIPIPAKGLQKLTTAISSIEKILWLKNHFPISRFFMTSLCVVIRVP